MVVDPRTGQGPSLTIEAPRVTFQGCLPRPFRPRMSRKVQVASSSEFPSAHRLMPHGARVHPRVRGILFVEELVDTDPTMARINEAVQLHHAQGQREAAAALFGVIWEEIGGEDGDPLHVCVLAHSFADVQDDVHQELLWDQRALAAADQLTDDRLAQAGLTVTLAGLYPSLHLNLADCYRRLGELRLARTHLRQAEDRIGALGNDEYGNLIRTGLEQIRRQLTSP